METNERRERVAIPWLRQPLLGPLALAFVVCFAGIGSHHLWSPDEPTGAAVGREMSERGDFIVPRLNGQTFLEKPPLYWWAQVATFRLWGLTPAAARFPSALFSALTLPVAFELGVETAGEAFIDPVKRMSDLTAAISREMPGEDPVAAYLPMKSSPESVYGTVSFDLGRRTLPLRTLDALRAFVRQRSNARVVLRASEAARLPADLLGRLVILYDERGRKATPFLIAGRRDEPKPWESMHATDR